MKKVCKKTLSYMETAIAAIIIMWSPLENKNSDFRKTLNYLQEFLGEDVAKSCIYMIQGNWNNWRSFEETLELSRIVLDEIGEIKKLFPDVPVINYDPKGSFDERLTFLQATIRKVKPYYKIALQQKQEEDDQQKEVESQQKPEN